MKVFLSQTGYLKILQESLKSKWKETGGVLIGYKNENQIVVTDIIGPGPNAQHRVFNFQRDVAYCNNTLKKEFMETDGLITYLGEWHTHPFGILVPSNQDSIEMMKISETECYQNDTPILFIVRQSKKSMQIGTFLYSDGQKRKVEMLLIE